MNKRLYSFLIILVIMALLTVFFVFPHRRKLAAMEKQLQEAQEENKRLQRELAEIRRANKQLKDGDPSQLTTSARDDYKYVKPGDKVYYFPENK